MYRTMLAMATAVALVAFSSQAWAPPRGDYGGGPNGSGGWNEYGGGGGGGGGNPWPGVNWQGVPTHRGSVPLSSPPRGCRGCFNDSGGLQDGGSRGNHRSDDRNNGPNR